MTGGFKRRLQVMRPGDRWSFGMARQGEYRPARDMGADCTLWISPQPSFFRIITTGKHS